jgi:hypothetical protein
MDKAQAIQALHNFVNTLRCPACNQLYTDEATDWGYAWQEGRHDALCEEGIQERDGPFKVKCKCGQRAWIDYFGTALPNA